ncbi:hypothetical protein NCU05540 [Neurospora crassa OR74A]|uniref:Uncharacterized protein n=1 Tax=Neurospora crassa (strain ATCC 24698 / 74-OR23-1A / CBS 708.71 / DSM 1257 / FGSC 987) TaxID=367110 RepID=Q7S723_NEUCR|nr:hypothetical protein NCU05540 [Neurospora crassa OR74A]EAA31266.2 hypothetical protein NCU05540 [Neurospora crassa OR74A]|eukprot:XP_960502.2 hypothetical protein NCU05540 [Neurospora crassa OR74A]
MTSEQVPPPSAAARIHSPRSSHDLVTVVLTTSPTPSAPSTELLSSIIASFQKHCAPLTKCRIILVLDTYDRIASDSRLKKGTVTAEGAKKFAEYKKNAKQLILDEYSRSYGWAGNAFYDDELIITEGEAEFGSVAYAQQHNAVTLTITRSKDGRITFIEPHARVGFGLGVRSALRLTETPYVWIQQHDWALVADIPLAPLLEIMQQSESAPESPDSSDSETTDGQEPRRTSDVPVKYVCFPSTRMVSYAKSDHVMLYPALRALTNLYKQNFSVGSGSTSVKIPLTPLFFWHDKPHLASTAHYLSQIFPSRAAMLRGAFIEDTAGQRARTEMKDGMWRKWACWLYYPDEGTKLCVRHLKGRTWRGTDGELVQRMQYMRLNSYNS